MPNRIVDPKKLSVDDLIAEIKKYSPQKDLDLVRLAYDFAAKAHGTQTRKSGELYINHPLATAHILAQMRIDVNIIMAALLHDVPEDTDVELEVIEKNFGADVASMIRGITKLSVLKYRGVERYIENLRKMFVAMAEDVRVMIIKFADRSHNLMTLDAHPPNKRYRIALESLEIYSPIANRLGMNEFKELLEDLSFKYVYPKEFERVKQIRDQAVAVNIDYLPTVITQIKKELGLAKINYFDVYGREKQLYSLYQKLLHKNWEIEKVYDVIALRIIVKDISDCYAALGVVHQIWHPLKGRIKDYIAQPKPNGYQSLHTTVFGEGGHIIEFQIRTQAMNDDAEYGVAAHWHYDERGARLPAKDVAWAKELAELQKDILNNISDLEVMKVEFFHNHIFVFTPKGDVIDLPEDSTPIDFAYHIHTEIGNHCNGAKVNDQLVSLDTPLKSGDVVEIVSDKNRKGPSPDWLKIAKTHTAKTHIRNNLTKSRVNEWLHTILPGKKK